MELFSALNLINLLNLDLLCIGHVCHDLKSNGTVTLGGTTSYCSLMAQHLGLNTGILTSYGDDFLFEQIFTSNRIAITNKESKFTTLFENSYEGEYRIQTLHKRAEVIHPADVPKDWLNTSIVKFCTIADEVDFQCLKMFPNSLVAATIQGWLRKWNDQGIVSPKEIDWSLLEPIDIIFMSVDDIQGFESAIPRLSQLVSILIITDGSNPACVYENGKKQKFPSYPATLIDPTGAGDTFAISFLYHYHKEQKVKDAVIFAHAAASLIIEKVGVDIPSVADINQRFKDYFRIYPEYK